MAYERFSTGKNGIIDTSTADGTAQITIKGFTLPYFAQNLNLINHVI